MNLVFSQILNPENPKMPSNNYMHVCITKHTHTDSVNLALFNFYFNMLICPQSHLLQCPPAANPQILHPHHISLCLGTRWTADRGPNIPERFCS